MLWLKVKLNFDIPITVKFVVGSAKDRHRFDANPDPDLDRHQHEIWIRIGIQTMFFIADVS